MTEILDKKLESLTKAELIELNEQQEKLLNQIDIKYDELKESFDRTNLSLEIFRNLSTLNVNDRTESKKGNNNRKLTYLSWAWAWAEVKKKYPTANYEIKKFGEEQNPYLEDENLGYMVFTTVTIEGLTYEMWLPVMDYKNDAVRRTAWKYKTRNGEVYVAPATMMDINKAIMRCLVKNLAMHGLGLYIYAGEDLPDPEGAILSVGDGDETSVNVEKNNGKNIMPTQEDFINEAKGYQDEILKLNPNGTVEEINKYIFEKIGVSEFSEVKDSKRGEMIIELKRMLAAYRKKSKEKAS